MYLSTKASTDHWRILSCSSCLVFQMSPPEGCGREKLGIQFLWARNNHPLWLHLVSSCVCLGASDKYLERSHYTRYLGEYVPLINLENIVNLRESYNIILKFKYKLLTVKCTNIKYALGLISVCLFYLRQK